MKALLYILGIVSLLASLAGIVPLVGGWVLKDATFHNHSANDERALQALGRLSVGISITVIVVGAILAIVFFVLGRRRK